MDSERLYDAGLDDREELIAFAKSFDQAWDRRDTEAFVAHFTPDATFGGIGGPVIQGHAGLRQHFGEDFFPTLPPGLHHVSRPVAFHFPSDSVVTSDILVDMVQDELDGSKTVLSTFPAVAIAVRAPEGWRVSAIRTGASTAP